MKLSVKEVMMLIEPLAVLLKERLPIKLSYRLTRLNDKISTEMKRYESCRVQLCKDYATKDDKGEPIITDNKYDIQDKQKFNAELNDLANEEFEVERFEAIPVEELINSPWPIGISTENLMMLSKIIKQDEEEKPKLKAVE